MDVKVVVAIIGICSVLISALVQFYLGRNSEANKKRTEIKVQAYLDLINSVSNIASSAGSKRTETLKHELLRDLIQSKSRVVLVGSKDVVQSIHEFFTKHDQLKTKESMTDFSILVMAMRKDLVGSTDAGVVKINEALFGRDKQA
ncbi:MAG: hypothetical protein P1R74_05680 [Sedimenticola sp.]|nr:hypothetical protein [Sedimenticola sp.]